ncbi:MAG: hypothetical protein ACKO00_01925, partial [Crocinitomicaceae bacterium]
IGIKLLVVAAIFLIVYLIFKQYIDTSILAEEFTFTSFKYMEYALLTIVTVLLINLVLLPLKMRWLFKSW